MKKNFQNKGYMVVEVLVAISIITAVVLATAAVAQKSIFVSRESLHITEASFLLEEGAEAVRIVRDGAWGNISVLSPATTYYPAFSGSNWSLSTTLNTVGIFTRSVRVASVKRDNFTGDISSSGTDDPGTKLITITVTWREGGSTITKTLPFYITDIFS